VFQASKPPFAPDGGAAGVASSFPSNALAPARLFAGDAMERPDRGNDIF